MQAGRITFRAKIQIEVTANTTGTLCSATLFTLENSPVAIIAAEQYANDIMTLDELLRAIAEACNVGGTLFEVEPSAVAEAIAHNSKYSVAPKSGFTLIELSIVLVIIGLLIGGILVAQSTLSTSKITATVQQISQFDAGVENFKTKYNALPGDAVAFGGDGNGLVTGTTTYTYGPQVNRFGCETANFWNNISPEEYTSGSCLTDGSNGRQAISSGTGKNVPAANLGSKGSFLIASALSTDGAYADATLSNNYYTILNASQAQTQNPFGLYDYQPGSASAALIPSDLLALDKKLADGIANAGGVQAGSIGSEAGYNGITTTELPSCSSGATYLVQNTGYECTPLIRIGAQAGDPQ